jgi:hypothetical protein
MSKRALQRRYTYLWTGEIVSALLFAGLLCYFAYRDGVWQHWIARSYSLGVLILILIQGSFWWRLKLRLLRRKQRSISPHTLNSYRRWRRINWLLISSFPLIVVIAAQITLQPLISADTRFGLLFFTGAILEQINYYYYQLMYDSPQDWAFLRKHRRLKQGAIARAMTPVNHDFWQPLY